MKVITINIESINLFKPFLLLVEHKDKGVLPFKWYENEEAWLNDPLGSRLNIDKLWDKDDSNILSVNVVLPSVVTTESKVALVHVANTLLETVEQGLDSWYTQLKKLSNKSVT